MVIKAGVSIIVCCFNSSLRLPLTLKYLASQKVRADLEWELLIINNNSTDKTAIVAADEWNKYDTIIPFRIVDQPIPGLSNAREKGVELADYEYLLFCDDDNWLFEDYVQIAYDTMQSRSEIGVLGGHGIAKTEVRPEPWVDLTTFATGPQAPESGDVTHTRTTVYGAGSIYRKSAFLYLKTNGFKPCLSDRKGDILSSGGDAELCWAVSLAGYKIWYEDGLKFYHYIPKHRLTLEYSKRMEYGNGYSALLHVPYFHFISKSQRSRLKNTWWWRLLGTVSVMARHRLKSKKNEGISTMLSTERQSGFLVACWKERKKYTELFKALDNAKWIK